MIYLFLAIALLLVLSALFSGSEIALATVNKHRLKRDAETSGKARRALKLVNSYSATICTILVGNNLVNIAASSITTSIAIESGFNVTIATAIFTVVLLMFGEIFPKVVFSGNNYGPALYFSGAISVFTVIFKPVVFVLEGVIKLFSPLWTPTPEDEEHISDKELITIVETAQEEGAIEEKQSELIQSAIEFTDVKAYEIMTPRVDVCGFDIAENEAVSLLKNEDVFDYSYIPVYEDNLDNIVGILNTKLVMNALIEGKNILDIRPYLAEPLYVHKTKNISAILKDFKASRTRIAVVLDEYGGTMGILTMEDIVEEIVGDIWDETDEVEEEIEEVTEEGVSKLIVDGDMNVYDFFEEAGLDDKELGDEYSTVGGWVTDRLERFAESGDSFICDNVKITVTEVDNMRVKEIEAEVMADTEEK